MPESASADQPLPVVMLTSSYPRGADDNASVFLRHLARALRDEGVAVHVLTPAETQAGTTDEDGVTVHRFRYFPGRWQGLAYGSGVLSNLKRRPLLWLQVPLFLAAMAFSLWRLLRRLPRPCVVHAHWVVPQGAVALLAGWFPGVAVVVSAHGADAFAMNSRPLRWIKRQCLRRSDAWSANTRGTAAAFGPASGLPAPRIIPMGVPFDDFAAGDRERLRKGLAADELVLLFVGRLVEKKGVDDLLRAFAALTPALGKRTRLWIVGDGYLMPSLRELAAELGVGDKTEFFGSVTNRQLPDYYAAADLFVGPSVVAASGDTEGQGVVFLEAAAARLCVLATRSGGIGDVIRDGETGCLVEPRRPAQLARAIESLLPDASRRTGLADQAWREARQKYDWRAVAPRFAQLYRELAQPRSRG